MQTRIDPVKKTARYAFASLAELGRYVEDTPRTWRAQESVNHFSDAFWDLNTDYKKAVCLAQEGWPEGADRMQNALKAFAPATPRTDTRNDFYGHTPNVPRFCAGAPDSMIRHVRDGRQGSGKVLTLYVPVNAMADTSADRMANFGLGVAQYVNQLEADGTRVEVFGAICSLVSSHRVTHTFGVKSADQYLDLAVMAFAIGHPAMFRRLGFAVRERCVVREDMSYGRSTDVLLTDLIDPAPGAIILNGMKDANERAPTPEAALAYITRQIERAIDANQQGGA